MNHARLLALLATLALAAVLAPATASAGFQSQGAVNLTPLVIQDDTYSSPYPSANDIAGLPGRITDVYVSIRNISHTKPADLDVLLVAPSGEAAILMSDSCGTHDLNGATFTFHQQANGALPPSAACTNFAYRPTDFGSEMDTWPDMPAVPYQPNLDTFIGDDPNGMWRLMVIDDGDVGTGRIANGWSLVVETATPDANVPAAGAAGIADSYPITRTVSGVGGVITGVKATLEGVYHERPADLDVLLVGPQGQSVMLMSDACGPALEKGASWTWGSSGAGLMNNFQALCPETPVYFPTNHDPGEVLPAPAPPGPYGTGLETFEHTDPNGEWKLYVVDDDESGATGFLTDRFKLEFETRPRGEVGLGAEAVALDEGATGELRIVRRTPGSPLGPATVTVTSTPATAEAGKDYEPVSRTVTFEPFETGKGTELEQTTTIPLEALADALPEGVETFDVAVGDPTGDAQLGGRLKTTVTIRDVARPEVVEPTGAGSGGDGAAGGGPLGGGPGGGAADRLAPVVGPVRVARRRTARFTLSEQAAVTLQVLRIDGRRTRVARTLRRVGRAGANTIRFGKRARPGRYRVRVVAVDAAGNRSAPRTRSFRVARGR